MPLDLTRLDLSHLATSDVKSLVGSMYTTLDANEKIKGILSNLDQDFVIGCLDELSRDTRDEIPCNAVELLVFLEGAKAIPWVTRLLESEKEDVRGAGCRILAHYRIDCHEARSLLIQRLRDDAVGNVRYIAADSLEAVGDLSSIPALEFASDNDKGTDFEGRPIQEKSLKVIRSILERHQTRRGKT